MERVDHVDVLKVRCRRFIGNVDRMLERQVPDRECLELGVSGSASSDVLVVELGQACRQFAASAARAGHYYERLGDFDIRIRAVALLAYDSVNIGRIAFCKAVLVCLDAALLELVDELGYGRGILLKSRNYDAVDLKVVLPEDIYESQHFKIVCDSEVRSCLVCCNVPGIDADYDLRLILHLLQKLYLGVFIESRQHPHGVLVLNEFSSELQVQPVSAALLDSLQNVL